MTKLLIVDDEKSMYDFGKPYFERQGYQVLYANLGNLGIEMFKTENPDVVILDLGLPDMEGRDVLIKMREIKKDAKIAVLTGFSEDEIRNKVLPLKPDAYFTKPCKFPLIVQEIKKWNIT